MINKTKHSRPVIVCDMDGIVGDFIFNMTLVLKELFDHPTYPATTFEAGSWGLDWLGFDKTHEDTFWDYVRDFADNFWENEREIVPGITKVFYDVAENKTWYWCTTRDDCRTGTAQKQSRNFLIKHKFYQPNVVVSDKKGDFCYSVNADYFLDDKFDNCKEVREKSPNTRVFFLCLKSQKEFEQQAKDMGMDVVYSVFDFINHLNEKYEEVVKCEKPLE